MINTDNIKKQDYKIIFDNTEKVFDTFNKIYDKDREAARYYILDQHLSSVRLVVFFKKHVQIILKEEVRYGVSISLKRYKSVKVLEKFYVDTKTGAISKSIKGKFVTCKPVTIPTDIKIYFASEMKWIDFVFKLDLPVTFNTIVTKKLYSQRKLLSWFWGTNYNTALKLNNRMRDFFILRNNKNIRNINNINPLIFSDKEYYELFINTLHLAKKTMRIINAAWSYKRLLNEYKKMNRIVLDKLYTNYNFEINKTEDFLPIIDYLKNHEYYIPKTAKEFSKICDDENVARRYLSNTKNSLIAKKNNALVLLTLTNYHIYNDNERKFFLENIHMLPNKNIKFDIRTIIKNDVELLNKKYESLLKMYQRRNKIKKIINNDTKVKKQVEEVYNDIELNIF